MLFFPSIIIKANPTFDLLNNYSFFDHLLKKLPLPLILFFIFLILIIKIFFLIFSLFIFFFFFFAFFLSTQSII